MNARSPSVAASRSDRFLVRRRRAGLRAVRAAVEGAVRPAGWVEPLEGRRLLSAAAAPPYWPGQPVFAPLADAPAITATRKPHHDDDDGGGDKDKDKSAPSASIRAADVTAAGGTTASVTVVYRDDVAVRRSKIGKSDLRVSPALSVKGVSVDPGDDGSPLVATYTLAARGGRWGREDNGTYSISVKAGEVADTAGNNIAATTASFAVNIAAAETPAGDVGGGAPTPAGADATPPAATITCGDVTSPGAAPHVVTVTYSDDVALNVASIDAADLAVTGPGGANIAVAAASARPGAGGAATVTATYALAPPGGSWDAADDGAYTVALVAGQVSDTSGNAAAAAPQAFDVAVPPAGDTTPPTAGIVAADISAAGGATQTITVTFTEDGGGSLDASGVGADDLAVVKQGGGNLAVTGVSVSGGSGNAVTATFTVAAPGGAWDAADNGAYLVALAANTVRDAAGNPNAQTTATFQVAVPEPDTTRPTAAIAAPDVVAASFSPHAVTVVYGDNVAIDPATIGRTDLRVSKVGPGGDLTVGDPTIVPGGGGGSGASLTVTYPVSGPGGSWLDGDNGTYNVTVLDNEVRDTSGNAVAATSASFRVNIAPADTTGPTVNLAAPGIDVAGGNGQVVTVTYADAGGIDDSSLGADDVSVSGPGGNLAVTGFVAGGTGNSRTVIYTVAAPGGVWDAADNGTYTVAVGAGAVRDAAGNGSAAASGTFGVNIAAPPPPPPPPQDTTPPTVTGITAPDVGSAGGTGTTITVVFGDDVALDAATITADDLRVTRDGDGAALVVTGVSRSPDANAGAVTATFTVAAPGGSWDAADNGTYTVAFAGDVRDTSGNAAAAGASDAFRVDVAAPDTAGPAVANVAAPNIITAGRDRQTITVTFTDPSGVVRASIGKDDLTVTGPGGAALHVRSVDLSPADADATTLTATYTIDAPKGGWGHDDNGTYAVTLAAGKVRDTAGNAAGSASATFTVSIDAPQQPDTAAPTVTSVAAPDLGNATAGQTVTVVYADDRGIDLSSIGANDLTVSGPGGSLTVGGVVTSGGGTSVTAVYTIAGPGGSFDFADNGAYTVTLNADQVRDTAGNAAAGGASATFQVNVSRQDGRAPTADAVAAADVSLAGGNTQDIVVTYSDDLGIDLGSIGGDDVTVSRPGGGGTLSVGNVRVSGSGANVTVTYTVTPPGGTWDAADNGTYAVVVNSGKVRDASGKGVGRATGSFAVSVPDPGPADPDFGGGQTVPAPAFTIEAIANQADGRILAAGRQGSLADASAQAVIERFNADGTLDATFGSGGKVVADGDEVYYAVAQQDADHVLAAGTRGGDFVVARYDNTGKLDPTFGDGGRVRIDFGTAKDGAYGLAVAPDGRIVVGGSSDGNFAFARLDAGGQLDVTFAQGGKQLFDMGTAADEIGALLVQADGRVVAAGSSGTNVIVLRLGADGEADTSFSGDGVLIVPGLAARDDPSLPDRSEGLAIQPDGKLLLANRTAGGDFGLARIDPSGNLDSGFGTNGIATADFGGEDDADAVLVQEAGQILVVGTTDAGGGVPKTGVAAFDPSGALIAAFGQGGKLTLDSGVEPPSDPGRELHVGDLVLRAFGSRQADGRLVIATSDQSPTTTNSALRKLRVPGSQAVSNGAAIGTFGVVNGKKTKLTFTDDDGTVVTLTLTGGSGTVYKAGGKLRLVINADGGKGAALKLAGKGGDGRVNLSDVVVNGSLKTLSGKNADLAGTLCTTGSIGKLTLADVSGATIASGGGSLTSLTAQSLDQAYVLSGAALGSDGKLGGDGADADTFAQGTIGKVKVRTAITGCVIGAGLDPTDGVFLDGDDTVLGGKASAIKSVSAKNIDDATKIVAGSIRSAASPRKIKALDKDGRFLLM